MIHHSIPDALWFLELISMALLGLIFGSFASALSYRIPRGLPVYGVKDRSKCPACGATLGVLDLIPLFSWLFSKGQCRHCGQKISVLYPAMEIVSCLVAVAFFLIYQDASWGERLLLMLTIPCLVSLFVIDFQHKILPNELVGALAVLGFLNFASKAWFHEGLIRISIEYLGGAMLYAGAILLISWITQKLIKKEALGFGDVKFFGVAGLWLGISQIAAFCFLSGVLGVIIGSVWQKLKKEARFPFGPALITAFFILLLIPGSILS